MACRPGRDSASRMVTRGRRVIMSDQMCAGCEGGRRCQYNGEPCEDGSESVTSVDSDNGAAKDCAAEWKAFAWSRVSGGVFCCTPFSTIICAAAGVGGGVGRMAGPKLRSRYFGSRAEMGRKCEKASGAVSYCTYGSRQLDMDHPVVCQ
jgi:hypothetical protein